MSQSCKVYKPQSIPLLQNRMGLIALFYGYHRQLLRSRFGPPSGSSECVQELSIIAV
eukprot:Awhi_evm1s15072